MKHENNRKCEKCLEIINLYPGFYPPLLEWFTSMQEIHPELHISCGGRGKNAQELMFVSKLSRAHYGESAHNYNAAIDIFCQLPNVNIYDRDWFIRVLGPNIPIWGNWYGQPGSTFFELPHLELRDWEDEVKKGTLRLVE